MKVMILESMDLTNDRSQFDGILLSNHIRAFGIPEPLSLELTNQSGQVTYKQIVADIRRPQKPFRLESNLLIIGHQAHGQFSYVLSRYE